MYNARGWKNVQLESIADIRAGSGFPIKYQGNTHGKYPFYKVSDMNLTGNETIMSLSNNWVDENTVITLKAKLFPKNTVIFPKVGAAVHTNKKRMLSIEGLVDNNVMGVIIRNYKVCIPYYLLYWFEFIDLGDLSNPGTLPAITARTVKNTTIPLPPLPEQRAIAHILQTIQQAKFTRQREIELERERKAALMNHLFTHGTKGEPRKQTEIGEIPESWEVVKLGDKAELRNGINFKKEQKGQGILTVDVLNMYNDSLYFDKENLYRVERKMKDSDFLKPKDILFVRSSLKQEGVAWPALFGQHDEPITFCGFLIRARLTSEEIDPEFLTHYFRTNYARKFLVSKSARLAITNVSQAILNSCPIVIPSYSEQRQIANIINSVDNKIFALEKEVEHIDELFHTMLEELMTGKRSAIPLIDHL